jgi:ribosome-binding factor A
MADPARAKKIADRIKVLVAETLEYRVKDERLGFITITDVRVTGDLQNASVFYTVFGGEAERAETALALESAKGKLRSAVGKGIGIRLTPTLEFIPDALPDGAAHLEGLLLTAKQQDAAVAAARAGATYAGDADPYKKPVDDNPDEAEAEDGAEDGADADAVEPSDHGGKDDAAGA